MKHPWSIRVNLSEHSNSMSLWLRSINLRTALWQRLPYFWKMESNSVNQIASSENAALLLAEKKSFFNVKYDIKVRNYVDHILSQTGGVLIQREAEIDWEKRKGSQVSHLPITTGWRKSDTDNSPWNQTNDAKMITTNRKRKWYSAFDSSRTAGERVEFGASGGYSFQFFV